MEGFRGYILTREHSEHRGRHLLKYTGVGESGPFDIVITRDRPLFFIERSVVLPGSIPFHERRPVALASFGSAPVDAIYFKALGQFYRARKQLQEMGIKTFEADILPEDRFLMERFINGSVEVRGACQKRNGVFRFTDPVLSPIEFRPEFSVLSLDIETGQRGELYSVAFHFQGRGELADSGVLMLDRDVRPGKGASGRREVDYGIHGFARESLDGGGWMVRLPGVPDLLRAFLAVMGALDPDILIGWHVVGFDLKFLERKYRAHNVRFAIGRDRQIPEFREIRKGRYGVDIPGRIVIDGPPALRAAFYRFENFRLETVASELLGRGKDIGTDHDKVGEIERRFREDKKGLARYNLLDCTLVSGIFQKTGLIDLTWKRAALSGLTMDRVGGSVAAFDHFMLPRIHRNGLVAPNAGDIEDSGQAPGGWVFTKSPGFFEQIAVFDFKSLYPSIIRTFKIDPLSRLNAHANPLATPIGTEFSRDTHVLPDFITTLMQRRDQARKENDPHLSQAVKILMNSFYGVMGTTKSRFYNPDLSRSITGTGRWLLKTTREFLEDAGYSVLYGDTDSVFVQLKPREFDGGESSARHLAVRINTFLKETIRNRFELDPFLEIEFEKLFTRFFLPALRGRGSSAKKRYAGLVKKGDDTELVFTGLEFVRSDWTRFARQFQYELFHRIFHDRDVAQWIRGKITDIQTGRHDPDLVYRKRLTKPENEYVKVAPPHVKAARLLGRGFETGGEISYVMTLRGPVPVDLPHDDLDYPHYIEKQLKPIADAVLQFFDQSVAEIVGGKQLSLF